MQTIKPLLTLAMWTYGARHRFTLLKEFFRVKNESVAAFVLSQDGMPLTPTHRAGKVRRWLKNGEARVVRRNPFTIQLCFETSAYTPLMTLGIDSGYLHVGVSVVTSTEEVFAAEVMLLDGMVERNAARASYRRTRRSRLRYRAPRFNNRKKKTDWLAPSIQHKLDSHMRLISRMCDNVKKVAKVADLRLLKSGKGFCFK